jgi:Zn-dependent peptidase ImmA (M78 family)/transcriptional regulator with XRE-family HTH domain
VTLTASAPAAARTAHAQAVGDAERAVAERIRTERIRRGWTQAELGVEAGLSEFQVNRIENGTKRLSAGEVTALAGALDLMPGNLLTPRQPPAALAWAARLQAGHGDAATSATRRLVALVDLEEQLRQAGTLRPRPPRLKVQPRTTGRYVDQAATTADRVRDAAGLDAAEPVNDLPALLEQFGIDVLVDSLDAGVSGLCAVQHPTDTAEAGRGLALAAVDNAESWARQRFTMAHELAHIVFGDPRPDEPLVDRYAGGSSTAAQRQEQRANAFASALLAPEAALTALAGTVQDDAGPVSFPLTDPATAGRLTVLACEQLGVSVDAMAWRLLNVQLIDNTTCAALRDVHKGTLFADAGADETWQAWEQARGQVQPPRRLLEAALEAYQLGAVGVTPLAVLYGRHDTDVLRRELDDAGWAPKL